MGGSVVEVGGRQMFLSCAGTGSPTVVFEAGLGETSASWKLIAPAVALQTRVCTYDRAERQHAAPASPGSAVVGGAHDLHQLLISAGITGPFILVAHSFGAQYVRIFADLYPGDAAGLVLLDAQPAEAFTRLPEYPIFYWILRRVSAVLPSLARVGVGRLIFDEPHLRSARHFRRLRNEIAELPAALAEAAEVRNLGDRPLIVVTAVKDAQPGWLPLQEELALLSTNSKQRVIPDATHESLVEDPRHADASTGAIRDVVEAVRGGSRLQ